MLLDLTDNLDLDLAVLAIPLLAGNSDLPANLALPGNLVDKLDLLDLVGNLNKDLMQKTSSLEVE